MSKAASLLIVCIVAGAFLIAVTATFPDRAFINKIGTSIVPLLSILPLLGGSVIARAQTVPDLTAQTVPDLISI